MSKCQSKTKIPYLGIYLLLFIVISFAFVSPQIDSDIFFELNHGRYILKHGFPTIEPFTMHQDLQFTIQKWATCTLFYQIYHSFHNVGLIWVVRGCAFLFLTSIFLFLTKKTNNAKVSFTLVMLMSFLVLTGFFKTRPQIFSYIFINC